MSTLVERVLGIDLGGEIVGWSYFIKGEVRAAGMWRLTQHHKESPGLRWMRLRARLDEVQDVSRLQIDLVAYEAVVYHVGAGGRPNWYAAQAYGAAKGILLEWAERRRLEFTGVSPADAKKAATGHGNADKETVWRAIRARWPGVTFEDYDVSDSAAVGLGALVGLGLAKPSPVFPMAKKTKERKPRPGSPGPAQGELYDPPRGRRPR